MHAELRVPARACSICMILTLVKDCIHEIEAAHRSEVSARVEVL